jgi:hypothetical protein
MAEDIDVSTRNILSKNSISISVNVLNQRINLLVEQFATIGRLAKINGYTRTLAANQPLVGFSVREKSVGLAHVDFSRLLFLLLGDVATTCRKHQSLEHTARGTVSN